MNVFNLYTFVFFLIFFNNFYYGDIDNVSLEKFKITYNDTNFKINNTKCKVVNEQFQIHFLYIGQGDCFFIKYFDGEKDNIFIIDAGENISTKKKTDIVKYLKFLGVSKIETLILTHPHPDHYWNIGNIIENFDVKKFYYYSLLEDYKKMKLIDRINQLQYEKRVTNPLKNIKEENKERVILGQTLFESKNKNFKIKVIGPIEKVLDFNDNSIVLFVRYYNLRFLFMSDAGVESEKKIIEAIKKNKIDDVSISDIENIDLIKIGHHGNNSSSSQDFVNTIKPLNVVNSTGPHIITGGIFNLHERSSIINRFKKSREHEKNKEVNIFSTEKQGNIVVSAEEVDNINNNVPSISCKKYKLIFCKNDFH